MRPAAVAAAAAAGVALERSESTEANRIVDDIGGSTVVYLPMT